MEERKYIKCAYCGNYLDEKDSYCRFCGKTTIDRYNNQTVQVHYSCDLCKTQWLESSFESLTENKHCPKCGSCNIKYESDSQNPFGYNRASSSSDASATAFAARSTTETYTDGDRTDIGVGVSRDWVERELFVCGNCGCVLGDKQKYCTYCGTSRNAGKFTVRGNYETMTCVYGPTTRVEYTCDKCKYHWDDIGVSNLTKQHNCPECGSPNINFHSDSNDPFGENSPDVSYTKSTITTSTTGTTFGTANSSLTDNNLN